MTDCDDSVELVEYYIDLSSSPLSSPPQSDPGLTYSPPKARQHARRESSPTPTAAAETTLDVPPTEAIEPQTRSEIQPAPPSEGVSADLVERPRRRSQPTAKARANATAGAVVKEKGKKQQKKQSPRKPKWDAERILTDPKSPLAKANLRTILSHPMAWSVLDAQDKAEILALFPDGQHILDPGSDDARPDLRALLNDDSFRYDCAAYTSNLALGRHDPEWLACAWGAHERRRIGDFDGFLVEKLRDDWGVELPDEMRLFRTPVGGEGVPVNGTGAGEADAGVMSMDLDMPEDKVS